MKKSILFFMVFTLAFVGCDKEKECNPNCGPDQQCVDGVCSCGNTGFILGNACIEKCADCFEGSFDCGCTDKYIFNISKFEANTSEVILHYTRSGLSPGIGATTVTKIGEDLYRFNIPRSCDAGGRRSTNIEFVVDTKDPAKLSVTARYHILPSNETLETCSATFIR